MAEERNYSPYLFNSCSYSNVAYIPALISFFVTSAYHFLSCLFLYLSLVHSLHLALTLHLLYFSVYFLITKMHLYADFSVRMQLELLLTFGSVDKC